VAAIRHRVLAHPDRVLQVRDPGRRGLSRNERRVALAVVVVLYAVALALTGALACWALS
jgi:hypothetical protein